MITMILLKIEKSIQNMKEILLMTQLNQDIWQAKCYTNEFKETVKHNEIHLVSIITLSNILKHNIILKKEHCSIKLTLSAGLSCNTKGQQMCVHLNLSQSKYYILPVHTIAMSIYVAATNHAFCFWTAISILQNHNQASSYEACNHTCTPPHIPKFT